MTDLEVYINTQGFLRYLRQTGRIEEKTTVLVGRDLRSKDPTTGMESSPRIARAVARAVTDAGHPVLDAETLPTPALASYAMAVTPNKTAMPAIMVTGSHIPADRNGVKFYQPCGEVLKSDEAGILSAVAAVRRELYAQSADESSFGTDGQFKSSASAAEVSPAATNGFVARYVEPYGFSEPLAGLRVVVYQHSSVARDMLVEILVGLGADVVPVGRVDHFVAVDTEDVTVEDEARYKSHVLRYGADALVSTDGDGDRPLVVDERGRFHRGDVLGIICAERLGATFAAVPVSATDAIERHLTSMQIARTRIGSPFVIDAMNAAVSAGQSRVVGWEANGGFLTATSFSMNDRTLDALPTRDAILPILAVLLTATERRVSLSHLFGQLPFRATRAGLLDDFAPERSQTLLAHVRPADNSLTGLRFGEQTEGLRPGADWTALDSSTGEAVASIIGRYFGEPLGLGRLVELNLVDGVRMFFENGEIMHLRPSGNAPQFRVYAVADSQARADALIDAAVAEPQGILRKMERDILGPA